MNTRKIKQAASEYSIQNGNSSIKEAFTAGAKYIMEHVNRKPTEKGDAVYDLLKIPDRELNKSLQVEIGKLKAYIEELEAAKLEATKLKASDMGKLRKEIKKEVSDEYLDRINFYEKMTEEERKRFKEELVEKEYIKNLTDQINASEKKVMEIKKRNKSITESNNKLLSEIARLRNRKEKDSS
jgi:hypothetical protein